MENCENGKKVSAKYLGRLEKKGGKSMEIFILFHFLGKS
jgi:hypothetical protein